MLGLDPALLPGADSGNDFEVWEDNWEVVMMFMRLQTQWNVAMGGYVGLNYASLRWMADLYLIKDVLAMLEGIQIMEIAALKALNSNG